MSSNLTPSARALYLARFCGQFSVLPIHSPIQWDRLTNELFDAPPFAELHLEYTPVSGFRYLPGPLGEFALRNGLDPEV